MGKDNRNSAPRSEISKGGKVTAGLLFVFFTAVPILAIIAYWPDRLPGPKDDLSPWYTNELFNVRLAYIADLTFKTPGTITVAEIQNKLRETRPLIHLNTLLLILVALGGFAGNMVHIATSFTTFVGERKFEQSWLLWYFVKPFSAAALALGFYFVFRGGFLNMSYDAANINLYGLMTIALLTGLFTDTATLKLKEVFAVLFKPKDDRTGKLDGEIKVSSVIPKALELGKENQLTISGENLNKSKLQVSMNGTVILNPAITPTTISFTYTIPDSEKTKTSFKLSIKDELGSKEYGSFDLAILSSEDKNNSNSEQDPGLE